MLINQHSAGRDLAKPAAGGLPLHELERFLGDMENEPAWRAVADKCADYYDHKQTTPERIARSAETGEPNIIINLIQRTINGALGQEAKTRLNWKVDPDADAWADVAAVLNEKLHEAQREARTDMAISEAYSSMLRTGIGWVEVSSATNPLDYPHRCQAIHRNEVWWDWRAKMADKSDAAWMLRQRWADLDEIVTLMPQFREHLEMGSMSGPITDAMMRTIITSDKFEDALNTRSRFSRAQEEWLDNSLRKRLRMYSVYYKQYKQVVALAVGTKRVRFNPKNPGHAALLQMGEAKLIKGPGFCIRHAMFAGPFRLFDVEMPHQRFPLIPFVCYSADDDYSPYGLVHGMIEPQNEYNERRSRLMWLLKAKQVTVDNDALDTDHNTVVDIALEAMRPDALFVLNANRRNANGLKIDMNPQLGAEQQAVMQDAYNLIQDVPGLYAPQFGGQAVGAKSGVALNSLMEQSSASLGETSDNYRMSRQLVGEALVDQIVLDHMDSNMRVSVGTGKKRRVVVLNTKDPQTGMPMNTMEDANVKVALGDVPATAAFKAQQMVFLSNALQTAGNDPIARAVLLPALIESGDTEHRAEAAKWLRQQYGVPDFNDLADAEAEAQAEQQKAQEQGKAAELEQRGLLAGIAKTEAEALKTHAQALREEQMAQREGVGNVVQMRQLGQPEQPQPPTEEDLINESLQEALSA